MSSKPGPLLSSMPACSSPVPLTMPPAFPSRFGCVCIRAGLLRSLKNGPPPPPIALCSLCPKKALAFRSTRAPLLDLIPCMLSFHSHVQSLFLKQVYIHNLIDLLHTHMRQTGQISRVPLHSQRRCPRLPFLSLRNKRAHLYAPYYPFISDFL